MENMSKWLSTANEKKLPFPILSFPGVQLTGVKVSELVKSGKKQAECMKAVANRWNALASVSLMDLSVEAEAFGSPVRFFEDEVPAVTAAIVTDEKSLEELAIPEVGTSRTSEYVTAIREAKMLISGKPVFGGAIGPFSLAGRLMDMTEIMVMCYEEPELVHAVLEKVTQFLIAYSTALKDAGADGIIMAEPAAGLLSPSLLAEFSAPYVKRIIQAVETELCVFVYHNCGNSTVQSIKHILDMGARALSFGNAIDLSEMLELVPGDILVMGNVDPAWQLRGGSPESVREATLNVLNKCAKHPNFILSSGCDIPPMSPLENIDAFFNAAREFYGV